MDNDLFRKIKETGKTQGVTSSQVIRDAVHAYYNPVQTSYDQDLVSILKSEVMDLQSQRDMLQLRVDYYSQPWIWRLFNRPLQQALPPRK
jgi:predicted AAA+ superfamily ATPase